MERNEVKQSLLAQLRAKGATAAYFTDMVNDYMAFWDIKQALIESIQERGAVFVENYSTGEPRTKSNPANKDYTMINKQMGSILKDLGLNEPVEDDSGDGSELI